MNKYVVMYCNDSGDICCDTCENKDDLNDVLTSIEVMHGELIFGTDLLHCEVLVINGEIEEYKKEKQ